MSSQRELIPVGPLVWRHDAGEWEAPSAISNPPRFRGKPRVPSVNDPSSLFLDENVKVSAPSDIPGMHEYDTFGADHTDHVDDL